MELQLGDSLPVPCVRELAKGPLSTVPLRYVRLDQDPRFEFADSSAAQIPVIDMHKLLFSDHSEDSELDKLHHACKDWGFFQVLAEFYLSFERLYLDIIFCRLIFFVQLINHGVTDALVESMRSGIQELFDLPMEEKRKLWQKAGDFEGFGQNFVVSEEQKLNWGDLFGIITLPTYLRKPHLFPNLPLPFRCNKFSILCLIGSRTFNFVSVTKFLLFSLPSEMIWILMHRK